MDKFYKVLKVLEKYQFWAICGAVLVVAIVCWWLATMGLAGQFQQRKTKLETQFKGVVIPPGHPNQGLIDNIQKLHGQLKRGVFSAWEDLYRQQKQKNPFPTVLGEDFKQQFENLEKDPKKELRDKDREDYQNFIMRHFPSLLKLVDVRRPAEEKDPVAPGDGRSGNGRAPGAGAAAGRRGAEGPAGRDRRTPGMLDRAPGGPGGRMPAAGDRGDGTAEEEWIGTVDWDANDINALEGRFQQWKDTPSTLAVVLAQEDLWVIEALLRVIANTNEGTTYATAAVKRIEALRIGRDAVGARSGGEGGMFRGGPAGGGPGSGGMPLGGPGGLGGGRPGMEGPGALGGPGTAAGALSEDQRLVDSRYVDEKGNPLPSIPEYPYAKHPYAEFKMMPIHMTLVMDQGRLPKLLVECANSSMPIEVRRVRILKSQGGGLDLASAAHPAASAMGGPREGGLRGGAGPPGFDAGSRAVRTVTDKQESGTLDIPVEIDGVIYIYNPPNREQLGTGAASAEKPAESAPAAPATGPAATPPAAAPPAARKGPPGV